MKTHIHTARVITSLEQLLETFKMRFAHRMWKTHIARNGNVPLVMKCSICSGEAEKLDLKAGRINPRRDSKRLRDENPHP